MMSPLLAEEVAQALQISRSEAYNKISGKSLATLSQIDTLCHTYNVSFEINPPATLNQCHVKFSSFHSGTADISKYLELLNNLMQMLSATGPRKISCATEDIPFYHLFKYPELTAFKLHFWNNRIIKNRETWHGEAFDLNKTNKKDILAAYQLYKIYQAIPCVEIWTKSNLLITIDQIRYAAETHGLKDKKLGRLICEQVVAALYDVETYAIEAVKPKTARLYSTGTFAI